MSSDDKVLGLICARGGSKGLPGKNIADLGGKPLLAWTIEAGLRSRCIDRLILSTDDEQIATVARRYGCEVPFMRPDILATDDATALDVVLHALDAVEESFRYLILLQPTSPFRDSTAIDGAFELMMRTGASSCVGVTETKKSPNWMYLADGQNRLVPLLDNDPALRACQRQKQPAVYELNGAFYGIATDRLRQERAFVNDDTVGYVMSEQQSVDIDTNTDLNYAKFLLLQQI